MGIFLRLLFLAALAGLAYYLFSEVAYQSHLDNPDKSKILLLFLGAALDCIILAVIVGFMLVNGISLGIGSFFFNPGGEIEHDPHADAIARVAQGDPEGAIEVYLEILAKDPTDTLALSEIARICCRDLGDTARAATLLERALDDEWPQEQSSFLANRLADIYLLQDDPIRARNVVIQIAESMDGTKYAANAQHRLHEIDRALQAGFRPHADSADPEDPPPPETAEPALALPPPEEPEPPVEA